jgi:hypothetical protein
MAGLPPPPANDPPGSYAWVEWYRLLRKYISTASSIPWAVILFAGSNITDIAIRLHNSLQSMQGGTSGEYYHLTSAQHTTLTGLATVASGTYTPTLTSVTNVAASTAYVCQYIRVGSVVTVSGKLDIDPTAAAATELGVSLPIASNLASQQQCAGTGTSVTALDDPLWIEGDAANDRAALKTTAINIANHSVYFTFTYQII